MLFRVSIFNRVLISFNFEQIKIFIPKNLILEFIKYKKYNFIINQIMNLDLLSDVNDIISNIKKIYCNVNMMDNNIDMSEYTFIQKASQ